MAFVVWNEMMSFEKCRPVVKLLKKHYSIPPFITTIEHIGNPIPNMYGVTPVKEAFNIVF
jgi:hypothetical protein